jgi:carboxyl-terminal processing protease
LVSIALITAWLAVTPLASSSFIACPDSAGFWDNTTIATPYRENISDEEKIAGLSRLWAEVKYNFANFDLVPSLNWDSVYLAHIPSVTKTKSTLEYYYLLQRMSALLNDSHTRVWPPEELYPQTLGRLPLETDWIQGHVLVTKVTSDSLKSLGLKPGMEIVAINGLGVTDYADSLILPFISASTQQAREWLCYAYFLLRGDTARNVRLSISDTKGRIRELSLSRTYSSKRDPEIEYRQLEGNISYINLVQFRSDTMVHVFDSLFPRIEHSNGLIFDLRRNTGGNYYPAVTLMARLFAADFNTVIHLDREYSPASRQDDVKQPWDSLLEVYRHCVQRCYHGPIAVLIGPITGSAAEDFAIAIRSVRRGVLVGETSGGSSGQALSFLLPGGIQGRVEYEKCYYPIGTPFGGIGVHPDIRVSPTVEDIQAGRDPVLDAAIEQIKLKQLAR